MPFLKQLVNLFLMLVDLRLNICNLLNAHGDSPTLHESKDSAEGSDKDANSSRNNHPGQRVKRAVD
jgi:hypothetical protein